MDEILKSLKMRTYDAQGEGGAYDVVDDDDAEELIRKAYDMGTAYGYKLGLEENNASIN